MRGATFRNFFHAEVADVLVAENAYLKTVADRVMDEALAFLEDHDVSRNERERERRVGAKGTT